MPAFRNAPCWFIVASLPFRCITPDSSTTEASHEPHSQMHGPHQCWPYLGKLVIASSRVWRGFSSPQTSRRLVFTIVLLHTLL